MSFLVAGAFLAGVFLCPAMTTLLPIARASSGGAYVEAAAAVCMTLLYVVSV